MDLSGLAKRMNVRAGQVRVGIRRIKIRTATAILETVVRATPVDTGKARTNWQVGLNDSPDDVIAPAAPGRYLGLNETANADAAIELGTAVIEAAKDTDGIEIANNVPYIQRLNEGWSGQAPAGFIEKAIQVGRATASGQKVLE